MQTIILAGGKGTRLKPYTISLPKPLVPVGEKPILEIIIRQLKSNGFFKIVLAVGHLSELIQSYFGDGSKYGISIEYSKEEKPLGTAGPLRLIKDLDKDFLVMNSDDLTDFDYKKFFNFHKKNNALVTIASYSKKIKIDLGVLKSNKDNQLTEYIEKPEYDFDVSMGIYAFNKKAIEYIPTDKYYDFPTLIKTLVADNKSVLTYPHSGYWLDIGRPGDYEEANEKIADLGLQE